MTKRLFLAALCLAAAAGGLDASNVFVMPGSGGQTIGVFSADPFGTPASVNGAPGSFIVLARPDGLRYFVLARGAADLLQILDSNFNVVSSKSLGDDVRTAVLTPDGSRLVVLTSTLRIFDTGTGNEIVPASSPDVGNAVDVAISQDSRRAFVLSPIAQRVIAVDLSTPPNLPVAGNLILGGGVYAGIAVGPNGLVYASLTNQVVVIDGATMTRLDPTFGVNGLPGRLAFTPDGLRAIAVNGQTVTGSSAFVFDLANRTTTTVPTMGQTLEDLMVVGNNRAFAVSNGSLLYEIALSPSSIVQAFFAGFAGFSGVTGIAVSNELPAARYLYVASSNSVARVDLTANAESGLRILGTPTGRVSFAGPASAGPPVSGLGYNNSQNVAPSAGLLPLIARFLDVNGRPVSSAAVTWSSGSAEVVIGQHGTSTTTQGFVQAAVTAPALPGIYKVIAASGGATVEFTFWVVTPGGGGGGTVTPGGGTLSPVSGNGQLISEQAVSFEPLVVLVTNADGTPAQNQQVTFEVTQGNLSVSGSGDFTCSLGVCTTGADGKTGTMVTASSIGSLTPISQGIVTARLAGGISVPFNVIVYQRLDSGGFPVAPPQTILIKPELGEIVKGGVGTTSQGAVQVAVYSGSGRPLPNVGLKVSTEFDPKDGPAVSCQPNLLSDSNGILSCDLTFSGKLGQAQMNIVIGSAFKQVRVVEVTAGPPSQMRILQGNNQSGSPLQKMPFPVKVSVSDAGGNLLAGVPVTWEVAQPGTLTLGGNFRNPTDANGQASAEVTLGQTPGVVALRVKAGTAMVVFSFTVNVSVTRLAKTGGDGQEAVINQPFAQPLAVQVFDDQNRLVPGVQVSFTLLSGSASVIPVTVTTDANGRAAASVTAGPQAGVIQIRASVSTLAEMFTLTSRLPAPVVIPRDFRNAASGEPGVTPGGIVIIRGAGIAAGIQVLQVATLTLGQLPTLFRGIEIQFGGVSAPIFWVSNQDGIEEVAVQVPFEVPVGKTTVSIRSSGGGVSSVADVEVLPLQPGIFETFIGGRRVAVATRPDGSFIGPDNPAQRGEIIRFYLDGLGQTTPATGTNRAGVPGQAVLAPMIAGLNDAGVRVVSAEYLQGSIGIYVVAIEVPMTTATGPAQSLGFAVQGPDGNMVYANGSQIPIR